MAESFLSATEFNPFGHLIGLKIDQAENGWSQCSLNVVDNLLNPHQVVHGAVIYAMADTGMGAALYSDLAKHEACTTIEIKITYFKPVTAGSLSCQSKIINRGKSIVSLESEIKEGAQLIAKASGTFYVLRQISKT